MKKGILITLSILSVMSFVIFCIIFRFNSWSKRCEAENKLYNEINLYYNNIAPRITRKSLDLMRPYIDDIRYGEYSAKIENLNNPGTTIGWHYPGYCYQSLIWRLAIDELNLWLQDKGIYTFEEKQIARKKTPRYKIMNWRAILNKIEVLKYEVKKITKIEELDQFLTSFNNLKEQLEKETN